MRRYFTRFLDVESAEDEGDPDFHDVWRDDELSDESYKLRMGAGFEIAASSYFRGLGIMKMQMIHLLTLSIYVPNHAEVGNVIPFFKYPFTSNNPCLISFHTP